MQAMEDAKGDQDADFESACGDELGQPKSPAIMAPVIATKRKASAASLAKSDQESNKKASVVPVPTTAALIGCGNGNGNANAGIGNGNGLAGAHSPKIPKRQSACGQSQPGGGGTVIGLGASSSVKGGKGKGGKGGKGFSEEPVGGRSTWPLCVRFVAEDISSHEAGKPFRPPSVYTKDTQTAKWVAEVVKLKPLIGTLERLMSSTGKCTDTEVKNSIKGISKCNGKMDKKLDYEEAASTAEEPTLSKRAASVKNLFESVKSLKDLAINAGKSGSIGPDALKQGITKVSDAMHKISRNSDKTIGFPLHWVQAWDLNPNLGFPSRTGPYLYLV